MEPVIPPRPQAPAEDPDEPVAAERPENAANDRRENPAGDPPEDPADNRPENSADDRPENQADDRPDDPAEDVTPGERPGPAKSQAGAGIPSQRSGARTPATRTSTTRTPATAPATGAPPTEKPPTRTSTTRAPAAAAPATGAPATGAPATEKPTRAPAKKPAGRKAARPAEPPTPQTEPPAPQTEPPAPQTEPAAPQTEPRTEPPTAPAPTAGGPPGAVQFDDRAGSAAGHPAPAEVVLWDQLTGNPAHGPELLALAAVERLGPEAARHTRWIRSTYPGASDDRLARAAGRRFAAQARRGALAGVVAGEIGQVAALGWLQARLVLHVAAAYGRDPCAPERAAELLVLLRVHPDVATARGALAAARGHGEPPRRSGSRLLPVGLRGAGRRMAARLVPGAGVLIDVLLNDAMIENLTRRATSYYRMPRGREE